MRFSRPSSVTRTRSSRRTAAVALPVEARLERDDVAGDQRVARVRPRFGCLVHLEPDAVAEPVEEAVRRAACPAPSGSCVGWPCRRRGRRSRRRRSRGRSRPGASPRQRALERLAARAGATRGSRRWTSPTTNVRVMSAKQPDAGRAGQMSMTTGSPGGDRACAACRGRRRPAARGETIMSSAVQSRSRRTRP